MSPTGPPPTSLPNHGQRDERFTAPLENGASRWILIADDDDLVRGVWSDALVRAGYRTIEARTGRTALELMSTVVPDLMILDLRMPDLSGAQVMEQLGGSPVLRSLPVLIVSGFLDGEPLDTVGLNVVGRLPKPVRLSDLLQTVRTGLSRPAHPRAVPPGQPPVEVIEA